MVSPAASSDVDNGEARTPQGGVLVHVQDVKLLGKEFFPSSEVHGLLEGRG